jgi:hypothetical protein
MPIQIAREAWKLPHIVLHDVMLNQWLSWDVGSLVTNSLHLLGALLGPSPHSPYLQSMLSWYCNSS